MTKFGAQAIIFSTKFEAQAIIFSTKFEALAIIFYFAFEKITNCTPLVGGENPAIPRARGDLEAGPVWCAQPKHPAELLLLEQVDKAKFRV